MSSFIENAFDGISLEWKVTSFVSYNGYVYTTKRVVCTRQCFKAARNRTKEQKGKGCPLFFVLRRGNGAAVSRFDGQ